MRLLRVLPGFLVTALSIALLVFIGLGEARRVLERFELEALAAQGGRVQGLMEDFLREGLPVDFLAAFLDEEIELGRFAGFTAVGESGGSTPLALFDAGGRQIHPPEPVPPPAAGERREVEGLGAEVREHRGLYRLRFPLRDRFEERVGELVVAMPTAAVTEPVRQRFLDLRLLAAGLIGFFVIAVVLVDLLAGAHRRWLSNLLSGLLFTVMAGALIWTLVGIYSHGARLRTDEQANVLAQRLRAAMEAGKDLRRLSDLSELLGEEAASSAVVIAGGRVLFHPRPSAIGEPWSPPPGDYERRLPLDPEGDLELAVVTPRRVVREKVWRAVKNFAALFLASIFLAVTLLNLAWTYQSVRELDRPQGDGAVGKETISYYLGQGPQDLWLDMLQVVWFLAVFIEGLSASFLPHYLKQITAAAELPGILTSALFATFFAAFVAVLVPAGHWTEKHEVKDLILGGTALAALGLVLMALSQEVWVLFLARLLGGAGQGLAFIGVQSYILIVAHGARRTRGSARQVFAQNSGVISGAAMGALVVVFVAPRTIFLAGAVIAVLSWFATWGLLPRMGHKARPPKPAAEGLEGGGVGARLRLLAGDFELVRTFLLVGATSKIVYNGVVFYSIPLIMHRQHYPKEDIGQGLMLFAAAVLVANHWVAKLADRMGNVSRLLLFGMTASGGGALLVGVSDLAAGWEAVPHLQHAALFGGLIVLGLANGFIAAPVVSHVLDTRSAAVMGSSAVAVYRVLERTGHVAGPLILGQLLLVTDERSTSLGWVGLVVLAFGWLFFLFRQRRPAAGAPHAAVEPEP